MTIMTTFDSFKGTTGKRTERQNEF